MTRNMKIALVVGAAYFSYQYFTGKGLLGLDGTSAAELRQQRNAKHNANARQRAAYELEKNLLRANRAVPGSKQALRLQSKILTDQHIVQQTPESADALRTFLRMNPQFNYPDYSQSMSGYGEGDDFE